MPYRSPVLDCPTAQPDMERARVFGLIGGTESAPRVSYLRKSEVVGASIVRNLGGIDAGRIYRFAATCEEHRCIHFDGAACTLADRLMALPVVAATCPACEVRASCRWHAEQGDDICRRCPQVITLLPRARERVHPTLVVGAERTTSRNP